MSLLSNIPIFQTSQSIFEARQLQEQLRSNLILHDDFNQLNRVAGVDVGYDKANNLAHASIVIMSLQTLVVVESVQEFVPVTFPYIPGLLSFREIPAILAAFSKLTCQPDLLMVDGHGIAHPRKLGIAAHLGVLLNLPSIGVAKSLLIGRFKMPGPLKGEANDLFHKNELIGSVLRSKDYVRPLFISPGHRISIATALQITLRCLTRYRLPEPTRLADKFSKCTKLS